MNVALFKQPLQTTTEDVDPRYKNIDLLSITQSLNLQIEAQIEALLAVRPAIPRIGHAVEEAIPALKSSPTGRLIYVGAGTSGRLGIQDGVELTPTFNWPKERCVYLMAGGLKAVFRSVEGAEDNAIKGADKMRSLQPTKHDVVIGLAASGTTPFTIAAMKAAREAGAVTIGITNNAQRPLLEAVEHPIYINSGAEVISGSTRLKAGTTQKIVLNLISNQIMIGLGKVHDGLMVDMRASNIKLRGRAERMVARITDCDIETARTALEQSDWRVKPASLIALGATFDRAKTLLSQTDEHLHPAIHLLRSFEP